jgi:hypothetical protein
VAIPTLADGEPAGDYEATAWLTLDLSWPSSVARPPIEYCLECGRKDGAWRLRVTGVTRTEDGVEFGPELVDLREQTAGLDPLSVVRQLLIGQVPPLATTA